MTWEKPRRSLDVRSSFIASLVLLLAGLPAFGQSPDGETSPTGAPETSAVTNSEPAEEEVQGSDDRGAGFGGPTSVGGTLQRDEEVEPTELDAYFTFKDTLKKRHGFAFGMDYFAVYQGASSSPGEDDAASGVFRIYGTWDLVNRKTANTGSLVVKVENRHSFGTEIAPQDLGFEIGYVGLTAVPFSDIGWALTNFYWEQRLFSGRLAFEAGILDPTDYLDPYALINPWSDFSNLAFSTNPTIPVPNQGLGAAVRWSVSDHLYFLGGMVDTNGDPTDPLAVWSSFFDTGEYFTHLEFGWMGSFENRFADNAHLMFWHADEREEAGVPGGWGLSASWSHAVGKRWTPFVRAGWADGGGGILERSLSVGAGYSFRDGRDQLGVGLNWGWPDEESFGPAIGDQYTAGVFYNWRVLRVLHLSPGVQFLFDPALNPDENLITVWGLRARFAF